MAPVVPDPRSIKAFRSATAFETWLAANHDRETELWLKIHKKSSGRATVTYAQALDVALCWGWIVGMRPRCRKISSPPSRQTHAPAIRSSPSAARIFSHWHSEPTA